VATLPGFAAGEGSPPARSAPESLGPPRGRREIVALMLEEESRLAGRVRRLAEFLTASDAVRVSVCRDGEEIEVARHARLPAFDGTGTADGSTGDAATVLLDTIKADLVGIFHFSRPAPLEGEMLEQDRELAYIEALGIRNPVHSLGAGRIVTMSCADGDPVEYGQPLFHIDRG
jgi:biotin carboxyl carrier protein